MENLEIFVCVCECSTYISLMYSCCLWAYDVTMSSMLCEYFWHSISSTWEMAERRKIWQNLIFRLITHSSSNGSDMEKKFQLIIMINCVIFCLLNCDLNDKQQATRSSSSSRFSWIDEDVKHHFHFLSPLFSCSLILSTIIMLALLWVDVVNLCVKEYFFCRFLWVGKHVILCLAYEHIQHTNTIFIQNRKLTDCRCHSVIFFLSTRFIFFNSLTYGFFSVQDFPCHRFIDFHFVRTKSCRYREKQKNTFGLVSATLEPWKTVKNYSTGFFAFVSILFTLFTRENRPGASATADNNEMPTQNGKFHFHMFISHYEKYQNNRYLCGGGNWIGKILVQLNNKNFD